MAAQAAQTPSQKQWTKTDKSERVTGTAKTLIKKSEEKKKVKTAPAGGGMNPPKPPKKGPGNKGPKDEGKRQYGEDKHNSSMNKGKGTSANPDKGGLKKSRDEKYNPSIQSNKKK